MAKFFPISDKKLPVVLHAIAWAIVIITPQYLNNAFGNGDLYRLLQFYIHTFSAVLIFYLGYLWLVPRYYLHDKKALFLIILIGVILGTYFLSAFINDNFLSDPVRDAKFLENYKKVTGDNALPPFKVFGFFNHVLASVLISGFAMGLGVMEKLKQNEKQRKELEKEKLNSELAFLKNQVSPHFFFNTLNNIYSLIGIDGSEAQEAVLKLSKLMRYLLYESEQGESKLSDEIHFMNHYIDLMKLRLNSKVELMISLPENVAELSIPPLLFIPFIENAFKHGVSYRDRSFIEVRMTVDGSSIFFHSKNSIGTSSQSGDGQHSGIGLDNVKKRLNLLFPGDHVLTINKTDTEFEVNLQLKARNLS